MYDEYIKYLKVYKKGEFLITEGDNDTDFFCLIDGKLGVWKGNPEEKDNLVKIGDLTEKGSYFGEMSSLLGGERTASIIAGPEGAKTLKFPGDMLSQMIVKHPKLGLKLCTALADHLKGTTSAQQDIALQRNEIRDDATHQFFQAREAFCPC